MSRRRQTHYSKTIVVKTENNYERDLFLGIGMPMLSDIDVTLDSRLNRIELTLHGEYDDVDRLIGKLRKLESYIYNALTPDKEGYYLYHNMVLTQLCKPPVNLDLFASAIEVFNFDAKAIANELKTKATIEDIQEIHDRIINLRKVIVDDLNRDTERFVITMALRMNTDNVDLILDTAVELDALQLTEYGYQFAVEPAVAKKKVMDHLNIEAVPPLEIPEDEFDDVSLEDLLFDGGKVVFMRDGKEVDESEIDT